MSRVCSNTRTLEDEGCLPRSGTKPFLNAIGPAQEAENVLVSDGHSQWPFYNAMRVSPLPIHYGNSGTVIFTRGAFPTAIGILFAGGPTSSWMNPTAPVMVNNQIQSIAGKTYPVTKTTPVSGQSNWVTRLNTNAMLPENAAEQNVATQAVFAANQLTASLLGTVPGVWGVGVGSSDAGVTELVVSTSNVDLSKQHVPASINGFNVSLEQGPMPHLMTLRK